MKWRSFKVFLTLTLILATPSLAPPASANTPRIDHLQCAGTYAALILALPYLTGMILMVSIAPRSGYAQRIYAQTTPPGEAMPDNRVRAEVERRKKALMEAFEAGDITLEDLTARTHACDAHYGHRPAPTALGDLSKPK